MLRVRFLRSLRLPSSTSAAADEPVDVPLVTNKEGAAHVSLTELERVAGGRRWPKIRGALGLEGDLVPLERWSDFNHYLAKSSHTRFEIVPQVPAANAARTEELRRLRVLEEAEKSLSRLIDSRRAIASETEQERALLVAVLGNAAFAGSA